MKIAAACIALAATSVISAAADPARAAIGAAHYLYVPPTQPPQLLAPPVPTGGQEPDFGGIVLSTG